MNKGRTNGEFAGLEVGDVVESTGSRWRYVITECRGDGAIAVTTTEVREPSDWLLSKGGPGMRVMTESDVPRLKTGDLIQKQRGLTFTVAFNERGAPTAVFAVLLKDLKDWKIVA